MDPEIQSMTVQLAEVTIRNTASGILSKVRSIKSAREGREAVGELEEIINDLIDDRNELVRIAQAYESELVAQLISDDDIEYISGHVVPLLTKLAGLAPDTDSSEEILELVKEFLSVETVTVLQLLGFNFRQAIGDPLTTVVSDLILSIRKEPAVQNT